MLVLRDTEARKEREVRWVWRCQEIQDPWVRQVLQGPVVTALRDLQGPAELLGRVTPATASFPPYEPLWMFRLKTLLCTVSVSMVFGQTHHWPILFTFTITFVCSRRFTPGIVVGFVFVLSATKNLLNCYYFTAMVSFKLLFLFGFISPTVM